MGRLDAVLGRCLEANNRWIARREQGTPNPLPLSRVPGLGELQASVDDLAGEWRRFVAGGGTLPRLDDVLGEDQGADGTWRAGLIWFAGRRVEPLADAFPRTLELTERIGGLRAVLWSVLDAGTELPEHRGPNAGVLRFHLGVDCGAHAGLRIDGHDIDMVDGAAVLFDDTDPHASWNRGGAPRTTLFLEFVRPLDGAVGRVNRVVQRALAQDSRYRNAPRRAASLQRAAGSASP